MIVRLSTVYEKTKLIRLICEALVPLMILTLLMNFSHKCEATSQQKKDSIFSQITDENNSFLSVGPNQRRSDPVIKLMTSKFRRKSRQLESHSEPHQIHRHRYHHDTHSNNKSLKLQPSLQKQSILQVSPEKPIHILFPLPTESGRHNENPFGITIALAKPVVDEALDEVRRRKLVSL